VTVATVAVILAAVIVVAVLLALKFVEDERQRNLQAWQIRLGLVADSRAAAVNEWLERNFSALRELSENASLQLYMTELTLAKGNRDVVTDEPAQASYLRNLLVATADRTGFVPPPSAGDIGANVEKLGTAGIGLVDVNGQPIVATPAMPPVNGRLSQAIAKALSGEPAILDMYIGASGLPTLGFVLPVFALQGDHAKGIGAVVGIRLVDRDLFERLVQPGDTSATAETFLARPNDVTVEYLSPLADGTLPLRRALAHDTPDLAAAFAVDKPGSFATKWDYAGNQVLVTSRPIANVPWVLVRKISRDEALAATDVRLKATLAVFLLSIAAIAFTLYAVWRHGSSLRATQAMEKLRVSAERFENITKFMRVVTNSQPTEIVAVDLSGRYTFANSRAAERARIGTEDMIGKTMASVIGPIEANAYAAINHDVMKAFEATDDVEACRQIRIHSFANDPTNGDSQADCLRVIKSAHTPLRGDRDYPPAVLMVLDDITELTLERQRSESMLHKLIDTLVSVVDKRDPFSADHSIRVAEVSRRIAEDMGASDTEANTVGIAGRLMNLGKIYVPTKVLTRNGALTREENALIANTHRVSADLLRKVPFDLPVVEAIEQMAEWWDGSGPLGLAGEQILRSARILAVANAFVALVSGRAYRNPMTFEEVANILLEQAGSKFDRKVVLAMINHLENRGGGDRWSHFEKALSEEYDMLPMSLSQPLGQPTTPRAPT
jgi:HD-GYP domain-containing protein (c-di-GMP phosphodiesterase class II)